VWCIAVCFADNRSAIPCGEWTYCFSNQHLSRVRFSLSPASGTFLLHRRTQTRSLLSLHRAVLRCDSYVAVLSVTEIPSCGTSTSSTMVDPRRDSDLRRFLTDICWRLGKHAHDKVRHRLSTRCSDGVLCNAWGWCIE